MSPTALAIVLAPTLISGSDPIEDAEMCMEPGKGLPQGLWALAGRKGGGVDAVMHDQAGGDRGSRDQKDGGKGTGTLVGVLEVWIREWEWIEGNNRGASMGADGAQSLGGAMGPGPVLGVKKGPVRHTLLSSK